MNALTDLLEMDIAAWIVGAFLIMAGINKGIEILGNFSKSIGKPFKWVKKRDADHDELVKAKTDIANLQKKHKDDTAELHREIKDFMTEIKGQMKRYDDNRVSDRAQSFKIQKELVDAQEKISKSVKDILRRVDQSEEKQNKRVQAEIKDKIAQLYRRYNATKTISKMQLEALEDLITTYEDHGGENSFVHSVVQKEMYTWKQTD